MALAQCRECGKEVSSEAKKCPHCGIEVPVKSTLGLVFRTIFALIVLVFIAKIFDGGGNGRTPEATSLPSLGAQHASADNAPQQIEYAPSESGKAVTPTEMPHTQKNEPEKWRYVTDNDEMTSKEITHAVIEAEELIQFGFPYSGGAAAKLNIRRHPRYGTDVILSISQGQFKCSSYDGCTVRVRFDNGPAIRFNATEPSDHSSTHLFLSPESKLIANLKKAKVTRVEAEFYQEGNRVMTFQSAGLAWPSKR